MKLIRLTPPTTEYHIAKSAMVIGSSDTADITVSGRNILPKHAAIWRTGDMFAVSDWNGGGQVWVNGKPVQSGQVLWEDDELKIADIIFKFVADNVTIETLPVQPPEHPTEMAAQSLTPLIPALRKIRRAHTGWYSVWQHARLAAIMNRGDTMGARLRAVPLFMRQMMHGTAYRRGLSHPPLLWETYMPVAFTRSDARFSVETVGTPELFRHDEQSLVAAWVFQCVTTIFHYKMLLQNNWLEHSFFVWLWEGVAESVVARHLRDKGLSEDDKKHLWQADAEILEQEIAQNCADLGAVALAEQWLKKQPLAKPPYYPHQSFAQYRHNAFLNFIAKHGKKVPRQIGAFVWARYNREMAEMDDDFFRTKSILALISSDAAPAAIPLWQASIAVHIAGRVYLFDVAKHDARDRVLAFIPGKPDDTGEPLALVEDGAGGWIDQKGRQVAIDDAGNVTIYVSAEKIIHKKLRPTSAAEIKAAIGNILHERDIFQPVAHHHPDDNFVVVNAPIVLHFPSERSPTYNLVGASVETTQAPLHIYVHRERVSFSFHPHLFEAAWATTLSQHLALESENTWQTLQKTTPLTQIRRQKMILPPVVACSPNATICFGDALALAQVQFARENLQQLGIETTVSDVLALFHSIFWQRYVPPAGGASVRDTILPKTLVFPERVGFSPRVVPSPFLLRRDETKIADTYGALLTATPSATTQTEFLRQLRIALARIQMLRMVAEGRYSMSSAAIPFLMAHKSPTDGLKDVPRRPLGVDSLRRCDELLWLWGERRTMRAITRMIFGWDTRFRRKLAWSISLVGQGRVVVSLRDGRAPVRHHLKDDDSSAALARSQHLLEGYIAELRQFIEWLSEIKEG